MPALFDTHAHLDDEQLLSDIDAVLQRARAAGVTHIMAIGTTADSSARCVELANAHEGVVAAVGIQPNYVAEAKPGDWERIVALAESDCVKAIGETGLDHYWDFAPLDIQRDYFMRHLGLAESLGKPFVIHMRDPKGFDVESGADPPCGRDLLDHLKQYGGTNLRGIMHSFASNRLIAEESLELGLHVSFAGMVTYKKSQALREVAKSIPLKRLLIETDAPYLSPHPKRGQRPNEPSLVIHTAECLAKELGVSTDMIAQQTFENACDLLRVA